LERIKWWVGISSSSLQSSTRDLKHFSNPISQGVFPLLSGDQGLCSLNKWCNSLHKVMSQWWMLKINHRIKRRIRNNRKA
jgi:hypothetical protein